MQFYVIREQMKKKISCAILRHQTPNEVKKNQKNHVHAILHCHCRHCALQAMIVAGHCEINQKKGIGNIKLKSIMFTSVLSIVQAVPTVILRNAFRSRTPRRYCHLITLVTSVYRKTNVFLTTVSTATPPGGKMGEWSPLKIKESNQFCNQRHQMTSLSLFNELFVHSGS